MHSLPVWLFLFWKFGHISVRAHFIVTAWPEVCFIYQRLTPLRLQTFRLSAGFLSVEASRRRQRRVRVTKTNPPEQDSPPLCLPVSLSRSLFLSLSLAPNFGDFCASARRILDFVDLESQKFRRKKNFKAERDLLRLWRGRMTLQGDQLPLQWKHVSPQIFLLWMVLMGASLLEPDLQLHGEAFVRFGTKAQVSSLFLSFI